MPLTMPRLITTKDLYGALLEAGVFRKDDRIRRFVIDAGPGPEVVMYVERWGDTRLLDVATTLDGVEIRGVPAPDA
jgi:hypothetical protein